MNLREISQERHPAPLAFIRFSLELETDAAL